MCVSAGGKLTSAESIELDVGKLENIMPNSVMYKEPIPASALPPFLQT